jgi:hypothetical protein
MSSEKTSVAMNWSYHHPVRTIKSWQSSVYAVQGSGHRTNETKGSRGIGVGKETCVRDTQGQFECVEYTHVVPLRMDASNAKYPTFYFTATSPGGRTVVVEADFSHRAKNPTYKITSLTEMMSLFKTTES